MVSQQWGVWNEDIESWIRGGKDKIMVFPRKELAQVQIDVMPNSASYCAKLIAGNENKLDY